MIGINVSLMGRKLKPQLLMRCWHVIVSTIHITVTYVQPHLTLLVTTSFGTRLLFLIVRQLQVAVCSFSSNLALLSLLN